VTLRTVVSGLSDPVDVTSAGDGSGRLFVVEQVGRIRIVRDGKLDPTPFLDIRGLVSCCDERGLLGLAFHPGQPSDGRLYVDYTDAQGDTVVSEFRVSGTDPDRTDPGSERKLLQVHQPYPNHNGGALAFGSDGMLYVSLGDGGSAGDPQRNGRNLGVLLAKILRIDVDHPSGSNAYGIPSDNPFVGRAGARPEIWLTGLRNPWRMRFDPATGDLWIGDVGQDAWEEIDVARKGVSGTDFGWNVMEGNHCYLPANGCDRTGLALPVTEYDHSLGCAVIGGPVVRGAAEARLEGWYLFGDDCSGRIWAFDPAGAGSSPTPATVVANTGLAISAINEAADGRVYVTDVGGGTLSEIRPGG